MLISPFLPCRWYQMHLTGTPRGKCIPVHTEGLRAHPAMLLTSAAFSQQRVGRTVPGADMPKLLVQIPLCVGCLPVED